MSQNDAVNAFFRDLLKYHELLRKAGNGARAKIFFHPVRWALETGSRNNPRIMGSGQAASPYPSRANISGHDAMAMIEMERGILGFVERISTGGKFRLDYISINLLAEDGMLAIVKDKSCDEEIIRNENEIAAVLAGAIKEEEASQ